MRKFLVLVVLAGGALYLWQRHHETPPPAETKPVVTQTTSAPATAPSPTREVSEHNWMKRSLDRASEVARQSRQQTQQSQDP